MSVRKLRPFAEQGHYVVFHDALLDEIMPICPPNAWKVLCFVLRKTRGWGRDSDRLSYSAIRQGTGIASDATAAKALQWLCERGILIASSGRAPSGRFRVSEYALNPDFELEITASTVSDTSTVSDVSPTSETEAQPTSVSEESNNHRVPQEPSSTSFADAQEVAPAAKNEELEKPEGPRVEKDEPTAADFVAVLDEDLRGADVPLMSGRKARYGREFREALRGGTDPDLIYRACDRIVERWLDDYHHKLSVGDAIGDVIGGKRSKPSPSGGPSRNGRARGTPDEVIEELLAQGGVPASMGTGGTDFRRYEPLLRRHDFSRGYPPRSIEIECGGDDSERATNARRLYCAAGRIRRRLEGQDQRAG